MLTTGNFSVDGIFVEFARPGEGPNSSDRVPLVFVHGGCHGSWCWRNYLPYFAQLGYDCYALNWYNHYKSEKRFSKEEFVKRSISDVTNEIGKVADHVGGNVVLIGHSMGGLGSQKYAEKNHLQALVLINPVVPAEVGGPIIELPVNENEEWGPPPIEISSELFFQGSSKEEIKDLYPLLCPESPKAVWEATRWTVSIDKSKMDMPKLVFGAELDRLCPFQIEEKLAKFYAADYVYVPGKGHNLLLEPKWQETAGMIRDWLAKNGN